jgi:peptidoglycan/LPS O-acetylase OafA/YrhL
MTTDKELNVRRVPALDFLRTCAILLVITWHLPLSFFPYHFRPATWAGVDLFFVLSGYLIGTQLLKPYTCQRRPSYWDFFMRRALRVMPAYFAVLALYFLVPRFREQAVLAPIWRFLTFTLNFGLDSGRTGAFSHAWSLCVEEHFYLVLPLIVYWLMRRPSWQKTTILAVGIIILGMILRGVLWLHFVEPLIIGHSDRLRPLFLEYIYYPTYNRLDGLVVGVVIAATRLFRADLWQRIVANGNLTLAAGLLVLLLAFAICQSMQSFATAVVGYPLLALGFGFLLMAALSPTCILAKPKFVGSTMVAVLSYCLYLTHKEIMHLDDLYLADWILRIGLARILIYVGTFWVAAELLHRGIEKHGFRIRNRFLAPRLRDFPSGS